MSDAPLLEVKNLRLSVRTDEGLAQILDHVELTLPRGRILGVVGEFGLRQVHPGARHPRHRAQHCQHRQRRDPAGGRRPSDSRATAR